MTLPLDESLTVEFKSDRKRLPDRDLVQSAVCLANSEGGTIYLGVEPDGSASGLHQEHQDLTGLAALIANRTLPSLTVRVETLEMEGKPVALIHVPKSRRLVATSDGVMQRRRLMADGTPQCVPLYPHEIPQRESDLGILDYSALPVRDASVADLDPTMRTRLRDLIVRYQGDSALGRLSDSELDEALGLIRAHEGELRPTVAGLLMLGTREALRLHVPTHEIAFQILEGTSVRFNEFYREPLAQCFDRIIDLFRTRNLEQELLFRGYRVPVPSYDAAAFREAFANAVVHRDYTRLGALHIQWLPEGIDVINPGGFVEGVSLTNILVVGPRPRNPLLADIFKRVGIVERTGRGVDIIYEGMLRYGRGLPEYGRSTPTSVTVHLPGGDADLQFLEVVLEQQEAQGGALPIDTLLALRALRDHGRVNPDELARSMQREASSARNVLERLVGAGLVERRGGRPPQYVLSAALYRRLGEPSRYVRHKGFDRLQQKQMVVDFVKAHGRITRSQAAELCHLSRPQASHLLQRLADDEVLKATGQGRGAAYSVGRRVGEGQNESGEVRKRTR